MSRIIPGAGRHFIVTAAIIAATLGLPPGRALAQRGNPSAPPGPPPAAADRNPLTPAPPPSPAANDGAGWLGITMSEVTAEKAREAKLSDVHGAVITGVSENSPAAKAGLAGGDIITEFRGQRVTVTEKSGWVSVLAPVYNSLGDIVALVEAVSRRQIDPHENVK